MLTPVVVVGSLLGRMLPQIPDQGNLTSVCFGIVWRGYPKRQEAPPGVRGNADDPGKRRGRRGDEEDDEEEDEEGGPARARGSSSLFILPRPSPAIMRAVPVRHVCLCL